MSIYFFGDIHGNMFALEEVLKHLDACRADEVYCLGDLVGWLPFGDRTLQRMRSLGFPTVAGNHDLLVAGLFTDHPDQIDRMQASAFNAGLLASIPGAVEYLLSLPLILERENYIVVHHSPFLLPPAGKAPSVKSFNYLDRSQLVESLDPWHLSPNRIIFSGHDHIPAVYELPETDGSPKLKDLRIYRPAGDQPLTVDLNHRSKYWIKAGSVGGPYRDGTPAANSVLYDEENQTVTLYRIPYPVGKLSRELASHQFCSRLSVIRKYIDLLQRSKLQD
jgi:predicted phosphodiesterase